MSSPRERSQAIVEALEAIAPSLEEVADQCGFNYGTLRAWKAGARNPSRRQLTRLAEVLDERTAELTRVASRLRECASD